MTYRWFSLGTPVSSINKPDRHDIAELWLKVALNTITLTLLHCYKEIMNDIYVVKSQTKFSAKYYWGLATYMVDIVSFTSKTFIPNNYNCYLWHSKFQLSVHSIAYTYWSIENDGVCILQCTWKHFSSFSS